MCCIAVSCPATNAEMDSILAARRGVTWQCDIYCEPNLSKRGEMNATGLEPPRENYCVICKMPDVRAGQQ